MKSLTIFVSKALIAIVLVNGSAHAAMSVRTAAKAERAWELYEQQKISEGIELLAQIHPKDSESKAYVARLLGTFYWSNEQPQLAQKQLQIALASGGLDLANEAQTRRMLADIYLSGSQHQQALPLYQWLLTKSEKETELAVDVANLNLRLAQCHIALEQWPQAAKHAEAATITAPSKDGYRLWLTAELQQHWPQAEIPAQALVELEPKNGANWRRLVTVQLQQQLQNRALTTLALAERHGVLEQDSELLLLAQLFASQGMPELAARVIEPRLGTVVADDLANRQMLARYWQLAKEWNNAIEAWGSAAELQPDLALNQLILLVQQRQLLPTAELIKQLGTVNLSDADNEQFQLLAVQAFYLQQRYAEALVHAERLALMDESAGNSWRKYLQAKM